jgi:hypothetical protein
MFNHLCRRVHGSHHVASATAALVFAPIAIATIAFAANPNTALAATALAGMITSAVRRDHSGYAQYVAKDTGKGATERTQCAVHGEYLLAKLF